MYKDTENHAESHVGPLVIGKLHIHLWPLSATLEWVKVVLKAKRQKNSESYVDDPCECW